jgi:hypothetical protein
MTLKEIYDYVDEVKPNAFSPAAKTVWMNEVEGMVQTEILLQNEKEVFQYHYAAQATTPITVPNDHTIGIADKTVLRNFRPGGKIKNFAPGGVYEADAALSLTIQGVNADGLTFIEGTFPVTGDTAVSTTLTFDGSSCEPLAEPPHDKIYAEYIIARIDYANGEYDKYDNSMRMFNSFWSEFSRWFARMYRPADMKKGRCCHELRR